MEDYSQITKEDIFGMSEFILQMAGDKRFISASIDGPEKLTGKYINHPDKTLIIDGSRIITPQDREYRHKVIRESFEGLNNNGKKEKLSLIQKIGVDYFIEQVSDRTAGFMGEVMTFPSVTDEIVIHERLTNPSSHWKDGNKVFRMHRYFPDKAIYTSGEWMDKLKAIYNSIYEMYSK